MKKFIVSASNGQMSEPLDTMEQVERWVSEWLPYGIQKCRTGDYSVEEVEPNEKGEYIL